MEANYSGIGVEPALQCFYGCHYGRAVLRGEGTPIHRLSHH